MTNDCVCADCGKPEWNCSMRCEACDQKVKALLQADRSQLSDGYHTFEELYEHRHALWMAVCWFRGESWRTRRHSDGELAFGGGWFVLGMVSGGKQITYHLPESLWDACYFAEEIDKAPEFDGHTSADVLQRIRELVP